jgi:hypothetical protein
MSDDDATTVGCSASQPLLCLSSDDEDDEVLEVEAPGNAQTLATERKTLSAAAAAPVAATAITTPSAPAAMDEATDAPTTAKSNKKEKVRLPSISPSHPFPPSMTQTTDGNADIPAQTLTKLLSSSSAMPADDQAGDGTGVGVGAGVGAGAGAGAGAPPQHHMPDLAAQQAALVHQSVASALLIEPPPQQHQQQQRQQQHLPPYMYANSGISAFYPHVNHVVPVLQQQTMVQQMAQIQQQIQQQQQQQRQQQQEQQQQQQQQSHMSQEQQHAGGSAMHPMMAGIDGSSAAFTTTATVAVVGAESACLTPSALSITASGASATGGGGAAFASSSAAAATGATGASARVSASGNPQYTTPQQRQQEGYMYQQQQQQWDRPFADSVRFLMKRKHLNAKSFAEVLGPQVPNVNAVQNWFSTGSGHKIRGSKFVEWYNANRDHQSGAGIKLGASTHSCGLFATVQKSGLSNSIAPALPPDWKSAVDPATSRTYYFHKTTQETTWIRPYAGLIAGADAGAGDHVTEPDTVTSSMSPVISQTPHIITTGQQVLKPPPTNNTHGKRKFGNRGDSSDDDDERLQETDCKSEAGVGSRGTQDASVVDEANNLNGDATNQAQNKTNEMAGKAAATVNTWLNKETAAQQHERKRMEHKAKKAKARQEKAARKVAITASKRNDGFHTDSSEDLLLSVRYPWYSVILN